MIFLKDVSLKAGEFALDRVSMEVPSGSYGVLMGKTGSGKTTILESIIGLRTIDSGCIVLDETDVTSLKPAVRGVGYVPQDAALFSTMTVRDQIAFALTIRKVSREVIEKRVTELAELLQIPHLLDRTPKGLSGGERQRVALGRALSFQPRVLCLDEPLSALDDETRAQIVQLLRHVRKHTHVTALHVTHNLEEAKALADCLFRISDGRVEKLNGDSVS
jgi:ABC-type sugar transport system ATPase subunit